MANKIVVEKVSPQHPDKVADRIAGTFVDYAYGEDKNARTAFEVLIGHGLCQITGESSVEIPKDFAEKTVKRISLEDVETRLNISKQDSHLANVQREEIKCGDNGVFTGFLQSELHSRAYEISKMLYEKWADDGKILLSDNYLEVNWANASSEELKAKLNELKEAESHEIVVNPLGDWTGGTSVDTGLTGRKLASDFYSIYGSIGGGNLHGKDLSKADVSINIYLYVLAQKQKLSDSKDYIASCTIGDSSVEIFNGKNNKFELCNKIKYKESVEVAKNYIKNLGGFEKFAEWGLV